MQGSAWVFAAPTWLGFLTPGDVARLVAAALERLTDKGGCEEGEADGQRRVGAMPGLGHSCCIHHRHLRASGPSRGY